MQEKEKDEIPKIDQAEIETLISKIEQSNLGAAEQRLITRLLRTFSMFAALLQEKKIKLQQLKDLLFGARSEKRKKSTEEKAEKEKKNTEPDAPGTEKNEKPPSDPKPKKPGHGRRAASSYPGAQTVICRHTELHSGSPCKNSRCDGLIFPVSRLNEFIQFKGTPIVTAFRYMQEVMRCAFCGRVYEAPLPEGVKPQRWDDTADAAIAIQKVLTASPYYRTAWLQEACGVPLPPSTQFERCVGVAETLLPIYKQMVKESANAKVIYGDDTGVKILELMKENEEKKKELERTGKKKKKKEERTGMHTTGIVAEMAYGTKIALYFNGRCHTGENVAGLLRWRNKDLDPAIRMSDGLYANWSEDDERRECHCLAHARRKFWEISLIYPAQCGYVLMKIGEIYENDAVTKDKKMSDDERLAYHQKHSQPIMEELLKWMESEINEKRVEPNSSLGAAMSYFIKHYPFLTGFLKYPGAPLDNNTAEQILKQAASIRKNSYFFKTSFGAAVSGIILSVLMTCRINRVNVWEYLVSVLRRSSEVKDNPTAFLPWVYNGAKSDEAEEKLAA